jgi:hypothetical protein
MGDNDKAFDWLDRAIEVNGPRMVGMINTDYYEKI